MSLCCVACAEGSRQLILCLVRPMPRVLCFVAALIAVFGPGRSVVAYCDSFPSVEEELRTTSLVFVGTVRSARDVEAPDGDRRGTFYTIEVQELLKGTVTQKLTVYSENSSGRFPMRVGAQYLVFADEQRFEGIPRRQWWISNCGNSAPVPEANKALEAVRMLTKA